MYRTDFIIISGIKSNIGGVGQVVSYLENNYKALYIYPECKRFSIIKLLKKKKYLTALLEIFLRNKKNSRKEFVKRVSVIRNKRVIILHPQSIGFRLFERIIKNNNRVYFYVMDNSFFCVKSYNFIQGTKPCLLCLAGKYNNALDNKCIPFPNEYSTTENIRFIRFLHDNKNDVTFLCQNIEQEKLLYLNYGRKIKTNVVGLIPNDFFLQSLEKNRTKWVDFVFHADAIEAKGLKYALELAEKNPDKSFLFPFEEKNISVSNSRSNIFFIPMRWDTGLKYFVQNCEVVLCLSLWSAPVEGAFLKSLKFNKKVAVINSLSSFYNEIPDEIVLKLAGESISDDNDRLNEFYNSETNENVISKFIYEYTCNSVSSLKSLLTSN